MEGGNAARDTGNAEGTDQGGEGTRLYTHGQSAIGFGVTKLLGFDLFDQRMTPGRNHLRRTHRHHPPANQLSLAMMLGPPRCQSWDHRRRRRGGTGYRTVD